MSAHLTAEGRAVIRATAEQRLREPVGASSAWAEQMLTLLDHVEALAAENARLRHVIDGNLSANAVALIEQANKLRAALAEAREALQWLVMLQHNVGKAGCPPEPPEWDDAWQNAKDVLAALAAREPTQEGMK